MANLVPYLNFGGRCGEAVAFYTEVFGGEAKVQSDGDRVVHLEFWADGIHFMGGDQQGDLQRVALVLNCDTDGQLWTFYNMLVEGGKEVFAPVDSGWGALIAHCDDRFGVSWMLNYDAE